MRTTPRTERAPYPHEPSRFPRHADILAAIITVEEPDVAEMLTHELVRAPRNRGQARALVRAMPKVLRRRYGFGWDCRQPIAGAPNWVRP